MNSNQAFEEYKAFRQKDVASPEDEQEESRATDQLRRAFGGLRDKESLLWLLTEDKYETFKSEAEKMLASDGVFD